MEEISHVCQTSTKQYLVVKDLWQKIVTFQIWIKISSLLAFLKLRINNKINT